MKSQIYISNDKEQMSIKMIHQFLSNESYWARGRSLKFVRESINRSLCFAAFHETSQIGFARITTDSIMAWISDFFVLEEYRGQGVGKKLLAAIIQHPELQNVRRIMLRTEDGHKFYAQQGFIPLDCPDQYMEWKR